MADLAHHAEIIDAVNDLVLSKKSAPGHTKLPVRSPGNLAFHGGQWDAPQRHSAKVPEETSRAGVNCVKQSVIDQVIDQWRDCLLLVGVSKPKANTLNIYCDVFAHNCQFAMTFNTYITVVMNRLTRAMFHKVV